MAAGRYRRAAIVAAAFLWSVFGGVSLMTPAFAQTIISVTSDANGNFVEKDANGNTYTYGSGSFNTGQLVVTEITAGGTTQTATFTITPSGGTLLSITSDGFPGQGTISCTYDVAAQQVVSGNCGPLFPNTSGVTAAAAAANAAGQGIVRDQTLMVTTIVSDRVRAISRDLARGLDGGAPNASYRGLSVGSADARWGVWGAAAGDFLRSNAALGYNGNTVVALAGVDYMVDRAWIFGIAVGYASTDLTLKSVTGRRSADGPVVGPYASLILGPNASIDGQFQYTSLSHRITAPVAGLSADFSGDRLTGAINLNGYADAGPYRFTGFTGYAYSWDGTDKSVFSLIPPFSDNTRYGVWKLGGEAGYVAGRLEAYVPFSTRQPRRATGSAGSRCWSGPGCAISCATTSGPGSPQPAPNSSRIRETSR
jgi:outer membrane autotransporter protein